MVLATPGFRAFARLCLPALLALTFAACGSSNDDEGAGAAGGGAAESSAGAAEATGGDAVASGVTAAQKEVDKLRAETTEFTPPGPPVDASSLRGKSIWYVTLSAAIPALNGNATGIKEAVRALGLQFKTCDGKFQPAQMTACIRQAVNAKPAGIITNAVDPANVAPAMRAAAQAKVPIMALSTFGEESETLRFIGNGNEESEAAAMNWITADSKGKANIFAVTLTGSVQVARSTAAGLKVMKERCPECKYASVKLTDGQLGTAASATSSGLLKNPGADYGLPQFDFLAPDFERGARQAGRTKAMKMVSTNASIGQVKEVASGGFQVADAGVNANYVGWQAVDGLLRLILGEPAAENPTMPIRIFDETNAGSIDLTDAANLAGEWWGPTVYKQEFPKLWGRGEGS